MKVVITSAQKHGGRFGLCSIACMQLVAMPTTCLATLFNGGEYGTDDLIHIPSCSQFSQPGLLRVIEHSSLDRRVLGVPLEIEAGMTAATAQDIWSGRLSKAWPANGYFGVSISILHSRRHCRCCPKGCHGCKWERVDESTHLLLLREG